MDAEFSALKRFIPVSANGSRGKIMPPPHRCEENLTDRNANRNGHSDNTEP